MNPDAPKQKPQQKPRLEELQSANLNLADEILAKLVSLNERTCSSQDSSKGLQSGGKVAVAAYIDRANALSESLNKCLGLIETISKSI
uniref:Uncharacterized protein n=1 Tax=viral metagenome TaxID=1070528 RepID=A0A6M3LJG4_9ZZZZ